MVDRSLQGRKKRETENLEKACLTFFGVTWCILTRVANHPIEVPGSVFQHVIPRGITYMHQNQQLVRL